jgi:TonB family protein
MKKQTLSLFLMFLSLGVFSQSITFKDCASNDCHQENLAQLFKSTQAAIFEYYGFSYNDSIAFAFEYRNDSLKLVSSYAWLNEDAIDYYFAVLKGSSKELSLDTGIIYQVHWKQKLNKALDSNSELDLQHKFPRAKECEDFNEKGQLACAKYFGKQELYAALDSFKIEADFRAEIHFEKGMPLGLKVSRAPMGNKKTIAAFKKYIEWYSSHFDKKSLAQSEAYFLSFNQSGLRNYDQANQHFEAQLGLYIDNQLWNQLKRAIDPYHVIPEIDTVNRGALTGYDKAMYLYLEQQLAEGRIPRRMWTFDKHTLAEIAASEKQEEGEVNSFSVVERVPIFTGCEDLEENEELKRCFQINILKHVAGEFKFPKEAIKKGIQGRVYINFIVEKDGSIQGIEVVRGAHPLLDIESMRVVSLLPEIQPAIQRGKPVRISFTLPINAKLR